MGTFLKSTKFEQTYDGDLVRLNLKPIEQGDLIRILSARMEADPIKRASALYAIFLEILPTYLEDYQGPRDASGAVVSIQDIIKYPFYAELVKNIGNALLETAVLKYPKALGLPLADTLAASGK